MKTFKLLYRTCAILSLVILSSNALAKKMGKPDVVAIVAGQIITQKDIEPTDSAVETKIAIDKIYHNEAISKDDVKDQISTSILNKKVAGILRAVLINQLDVVVSEKEIAIQIPIFEKQFQIPKSTDKLKTLNTAILNAVTMVYDDHGNPQEAYNKYLKEQIPEVQWKVYLVSYKEQERRQDLARDIESLKKVTKEQIDAATRTNVIRLLEDKKLTAAILSEIAKMDVKTKQDVDKFNKGEFSRGSEGMKRLRAQSDKWWHEQDKKYIVVKNHDYDSLYDFVGLDVLFPFFS